MQSTKQTATFFRLSNHKAANLLNATHQQAAIGLLQPNKQQPSAFQNRLQSATAAQKNNVPESQADQKATVHVRTAF